MNMIPNTWATRLIGEVLSPLEDGKILHQGWSPRCDPEASNDPAEWAVLKTTAVQDGWFDGSFNKRLPKALSPKPHLEVQIGDILITCAGPRSRCGVACLVTTTRPRLIISGKMYRFRARDSLIQSDFLLAYLRSPEGRAEIDRMKTGGNESGLNLTHERFFQLRVPIAPLDEQKHIMAKLSSLSARTQSARDELRHIPKLIKRQKAALLVAALRGDLTTDWRTENPDAITADQLHLQLLRDRKKAWDGGTNQRAYKLPAARYDVPTELPRLPLTWKYIPVEHLSTKVVDGVHKKPDYITDGIPFLTVRNLTAGSGIDFSDVRYISKSDHEEFYRRANPTLGDILITKDGTLGITRAIRTKETFSIFVIMKW